MKRFISIAFILLLLSVFSVTAFASELSETPPSDSTDSIETVDISSLFNVVGDSRTAIPSPPFPALFDYDPSTQVATAILSDSFRENMPDVVRNFLTGIEDNPSNYFVLIHASGNTNYQIFFVEVLVPITVFVENYRPYNFYFGDYNSFNNFRYLTFSFSPNSISFPSYVEYSSRWPSYTGPYYLSGSFLDGSLVTVSPSVADGADTFWPISSFRFLSSGKKLTVHYNDTNGNTVVPSVTHSFSAGEDYSIASPAVAGYTPSQTVISGVMPDTDLSFDVVYSPKPYKLTVDFINSSGRSVAPSVKETVYYNSAYTVDCPSVAGYTPDAPSITGVMPPRDFVDKGTYTTNPYTLTVNFLNYDGTVVHEPHVSTVLYGDSYSVPVPAIDGFDSLSSVVTGVMPPNDHVVNFKYSKPMTDYDKMLSSSLVNLSDSVSSNALVLCGIGVLLMASLITVILLVRLLYKFSSF